MTYSSLSKNLVDHFVSKPKVGETLRDTVNTFEQVRSSSKLAPFGGTFSEEEETEEESESVSRTIGLQFPGEWFSGKSDMVVSDGMSGQHH